MSLQQLNLALLLVGAVVMVLGLFSNDIKRLWLSEPLVATAVGVLLGPAALGLFDISEWGTPAAVLAQTSRITLAIGIMGVALRLPRDFVPRYWRPVAVLLGLVMVLMWATSGLLAYGLLGLPFWVAMLVGATVTPTDPVLASSIVTGSVAQQNLPRSLRDVLSAESGANDGLAYPYIFLPLYILTYPTAQAAGLWFTTVILREVLGGVALGFALGYGSGLLLRLAESRLAIGITSFLAYALALALVALGVAYFLGSDGLLAVFAAGVGFSLTMRPGQKDRAEHQEHFQEAVNRFFILPVFVLFGLALPWAGWRALGLGGIALAVLTMLFRRLPGVLLFSRALAPVGGLKNTLFVGWFGPVGVAAIYYATLLQQYLGDDRVWVVTSLIVLASIVVHGVTSTPFTLAYGRKKTGPDTTRRSG